jgi:hypothetical protein
VHLAVAGPVDAASGMYDVEVCPAVWTSQHGLVGSHDLVQRRPGQRLAAVAAPVPVGEEVLADPARQYRDAVDPETAHLPGRQAGHADFGCSAATTSIDSTSGAAARIASSTASSSVTDDDGQVLQLPENCSRTMLPSGPSATSIKWTSPPCDPR